MTMRTEEERFEADLRAALAPEPASMALRQRVLAEATRENRTATRARSGWRAMLDPQNWLGNWRVLELGALAATASLAVGIFAGASGLMPDATTTTVASNDGNTFDLVALAYDDSTGVTGDLQ
jgi:hypothetical protein